MDETTDAALKGEDAFQRLNAQARVAGATITAALKAGELEGRRLDDALKGVGQRLTDIALSTATKSLGGLLTGALTSGLQGVVGGAAGFAAPAALSSLTQVFASGGGSGDAPAAAAAGQRAVAVTMNIATPDVESFRRAEAQVSASLARAVSRGERGL
jgi:hypothetical protein